MVVAPTPRRSPALRPQMAPWTATVWRSQRGLMAARPSVSLASSTAQWSLTDLARCWAHCWATPSATMRQWMGSKASKARRPSVAPSAARVAGQEVRQEARWDSLWGSVGRAGDDCRAHSSRRWRARRAWAWAVRAAAEGSLHCRACHSRRRLGVWAAALRCWESGAAHLARRRTDTGPSLPARSTHRVRAAPRPSHRSRALARNTPRPVRAPESCYAPPSAARSCDQAQPPQRCSRGGQRLSLWALSLRHTCPSRRLESAPHWLGLTMGPHCAAGERWW